MLGRFLRNVYQRNNGLIKWKAEIGQHPEIFNYKRKMVNTEMVLSRVKLEYHSHINLRLALQKYMSYLPQYVDNTLYLKNVER